MSKSKEMGLPVLEVGQVWELGRLTYKKHARILSVGQYYIDVQMIDRNERQFQFTVEGFRKAAQRRLYPT